MTVDVLAQLEPLADTAPPPRCVLIVDDDPAQVEPLVRRLSSQGYGTLVAHAGAAALRLAEDKLPDLILLDIHLPDVDGLTVCRELSDSPLTCSIPIIIVSGTQRPDALRGSRTAGCTFFLQKPYDPNTLLALIERCLNIDHYGQW